MLIIDVKKPKIRLWGDNNILKVHCFVGGKSEGEKWAAEGEIKMGKILGALLILGMLVLGFSEGFTRQKDLEEVSDGKECERCSK